MSSNFCEQQMSIDFIDKSKYHKIMNEITAHNHKHTLINKHYHHKKNISNPGQNKKNTHQPQLIIFLSFFILIIVAALVGRNILLNINKKTPTINQKKYFFGVGIGVTFKDGQAIVSRIIPGTPAEKSGVMLNDVIIAINSIPISTNNSHGMCREIRGQEGSSVNLSIERQNKLINKKFTREKIYSQTPTTCQ